jgi:hypothetical protein
MSEDQNIQKSQEDGKIERPKEVNENISQQQTIETPKLQIEQSEIPLTSETQNSKLETENMEVHHHPKVEKKSLKEYFLEFLMIFLAVSLGFLAENLRENMANHEKEKHYVNSILKDLQKDTANISLSLRNQDWLVGKMNNVLRLPVEKLRDVSLQDTLYQNLVPFYAGFWVFVQTNNTLTQLKNAGDFGVFTNQDVVDSITGVYYYYDIWMKMNSDFYMKWYEKTADLATQLIRLPETNLPFDDSKNRKYQTMEKF